MEFVNRHIGPSQEDRQNMLKELGLSSIENLIEETIPKSIRLTHDLQLPPPMEEAEFLQHAQQIGQKNQKMKSFIGQGYYDGHTPTVILRNILENPGWYTAYTPYQSEISQGRMEALLNFQTMVMELTALPMANASLLDEGTAAAEAMTLCWSARKNKNSHILFVDQNIFPQTLEVLKTRAQPLGLSLKVGDASQVPWNSSYFALLLQYPGANGTVLDWQPVVEQAHQHGLLTIAIADFLSLCHLRPPGEWGADVVVGNTQRFGVPMGFGGPHAAFMATREEFKRMIPGRIIGVSKDSAGHPALRLALQTREQHIRREKATSNICTAQVLLAVMASMYAVYHGPQGLKKIAQRVHQFALRFAKGLLEKGYPLVSTTFFDTVQVRCTSAQQAHEILATALEHKMNLGHPQSEILNIAWDEMKTEDDLFTLLEIFSRTAPKSPPQQKITEKMPGLPTSFLRTSPFLTQHVFNSYHSETEMLRYMHRLESKDLALNQAMIPLGSCTMKLNATSEMIPVTWPEFSQIHPFAPPEQTKGYTILIEQFESWLMEITGFSAISLQPNAGSQGEYAGLLVIRQYLEKIGQAQRNICLIPSSAHGTNPASAVMAGFKVVVIQCDAKGNIDLEDLAAKVEEHKAQLAALMVTYPSTHGVFEESIQEICALIHKNGGQVYMDGANMNALVGLCRPAQFGVDVSHLNLHKTFCIPHGGGGPGVGPIGVAAHLKPFLPQHHVGGSKAAQKSSSILEPVGPVSSAPWGSASILPISWGYIAMMGAKGLRLATETAILNANYIAHKLSPYYPTLYTNHNGRVAHECILDLRPLKESAQITVDDVAKRLMDFGFHAPTMSWPVPGTLMIEPTESESKEELDRFIAAMIQIRQEIADIEAGHSSRDNNILKNAPHTAEALLSSTWTASYSREQAAFPLPWVRQRKFWPSVGRIDNAFGDKNLVCSCDPMESYEIK